MVSVTFIQMVEVGLQYRTPRASGTVSTLRKRTPGDSLKHPVEVRSAPQASGTDRGIPPARIRGTVKKSGSPSRCSRRYVPYSEFFVTLLLGTRSTRVCSLIDIIGGRLWRIGEAAQVMPDFGEGFIID